MLGRRLFHMNGIFQRLSGTNSVPPGWATTGLTITTRFTRRCASNVSASRIQAGAFAWPLASKAHKGGEDSFFLFQPQSEAGEPPSAGDNRLLLTCGVADGVGGSAQPDVYSNAVMDACQKYAHSNPATHDPLTILQGAWDDRPALSNGDIDGRCTACLVSIVYNTTKNSMQLHCANVGDSGYLVFRKGKLLTRSTPQLHGQNDPYQLGPMGGDRPGDAQLTGVELQRGDYVVLCSDGVLDNLFSSHISLVLDGPDALQETIDRIKAHKSSSNKWYNTWLEQRLSPLEHVANLSIPETVEGSRHEGDPSMVERARELCGHAVAVYLSDRCMTPWAKELYLFDGGGKPDDVTALVIQVA